MLPKKAGKLPALPKRGSRERISIDPMFSQLGDKLQDIFKDLRGHGTISESNINDALRQVRLALLEADVDFQVAKNFVARVKEKALGEEVLRSITPSQKIVKMFKDYMTGLIRSVEDPLE